MPDHREKGAVTARFVEWINDRAASTMPEASLERARTVLLDSLGCALAAGGNETARGVLLTVESLGGNRDCAVIGHSLRTSLPFAAFANSVLIRTLDLNDVYAGPGQVGHPSDNVAVALSAAEYADRQGRDLLQAIGLGYEIYGRIEDMFDPDSTHWDHVTASGLAAAAMTGWLLGLTPDRLGNALALAATHCAGLREIRGGHVSAAKSIANGVVVQSATLLTLLAAKDITGPSRALDGPHGFANVMLDGTDFETFFAMDGQADRLLSGGLKLFPCFALAQGPISLAIELRSRLDAPLETLQQIVVSLADCSPARTRLGDAASRIPTSHEEADHSIHYLVAVALADGYVGLDQFEGERWRDPDLIDLMSRIEARIDPDLPVMPVSAFPCRIEAHVKNGERLVVECPAAPGHPSNPLSWSVVKEKFDHCVESVLSTNARQQTLELVENIEDLRSVRRLLDALVPEMSR